MYKSKPLFKLERSSLRTSLLRYITQDSRATKAQNLAKSQNPVPMEEASDPAFPVRHISFSLEIKGNKTDVVISSYDDHILVVATQIGSMGTILHARKEEGVSVEQTFTVAVVFGKRDEPMLVACARKLIEYMSNSGSSKALVLSLGLRDHSVETLKGIVSAVTEKLF